MRNKFVPCFMALVTGLCLLMAAPRGVAADAGKEAQNPLASLISVPIETDYNSGLGPFDRDQTLMVYKPVVPFELGGGWNLVTRTIIPTFVPQPIITTPNKDVYGLGDINPQFFFVAPPKGILTWGVGPQFTLPTATRTATGADKWQAGPTGVIVLTPGNIVTGLLVNQSWSFADASGGSTRPDVSQMTIQPFFNYNFKSAPGWFAYTNPTIFVNWKASGNKWTVPLGGGLGKSFKIGGQHMQAKLGAFANVVKASSREDWQAQFTLSFLFPQKN
jgi:hypothetical protein